MGAAQPDLGALATAVAAWEAAKVGVYDDDVAKERAIVAAREAMDAVVATLASQG